MTDVHMHRAIGLSCESVSQGGGPFGAVVVLEGRVLGEGENPGRAGQRPDRTRKDISHRLRQ
jgi:tRNA(Arg) A34 adenosine deaminase TadA